MPVDELVARVSADSIRGHFEVLAHDSLGGRGTGTAGAREAARYISGRLASFGYTPAPGPPGSCSRSRLERCR